LDNTDNENAGIYGEAHVYDGEKWVSTEESDALAMTYKDALQLAEDSGKTIYASEIYADLIVTKRLRVQSGNFLTKINETDGVDVTYDGKKLFKVEPLTGLIYFGEHFWYNPSDGAIHTPNDKTVIRADGTIEAVDGSFAGNIIANSGLFKGIFDTTALRLEPGDATVLSKYVDDNYNQALDLYNYFVTSQGLLGDTYYKISSPTSGTYTFTGVNYPPLDFSEIKYITFAIDGLYRCVAFYNSTYKLLRMIRKRVDGSTTGQIKINSSFTLGVSYGGDKLIVSSDIPTDTNGLDDYQIYLSGDTLKVKLP
jgi:hypothetical protein